MEILPIPGFSEMSQMLSQNLAEASPGTVSQFFEKAAQSVMSDLMKADDVTDVKKGTVARLDRLGFSRGSLEAFSSISSKLPSFIIDTLRVYKNNPQCEPPGFLRSFFVQKEHSWALNDTGNLLLVLFEKERGGISAFFEANALELVRNICAQLRDPTFSLPPELLSGGDPTARAQAITAFILERANIESLTFPVVLRPFQPLLLTLVKPLLEKKIETDLLPFLEVLPQTAVRKLAEPKKTAPPPPLMPPELYATYADFGRILGPALLENIPELSMLSDAC